MTSLQKRMLKDLKDKSALEKVINQGSDFIHEALDRHIYPTENAQADLKEFDESLAAMGVDFNQLIDQLDEFGRPSTLPFLGGRYFGFVTGGMVPAGLFAKLLATFWDQVSAMHVMSPLASKLETVVEQWLVELFGLPQNTCAGFVSGTSSANLCGLAAGRFRILKNLGWDIGQKGLNGAPKIRIISGNHAHSTIHKALNILGFGVENLELIDVDDQGRVKSEALPKLDKNCIVILQAGNVNSGSYDHFKQICQKAKDAHAWVHIDGAFGLWAAAIEKLSHLTDGIELANSWAVDGHKTLNTPYDSGIIMCADREALISALHMSAGYIVHSEERDGMLYTPEMSRRARVIELWATMKYLGKEGISDMIYNMHEMAKLFATQISQVDGFSVLNDIVFNQVLVRCGSDELTENVIKKIQELRVCWVGGSTWFGQRVIRVSICSWVTNPDDVALSVASFNEAMQLVKN